MTMPPPTPNNALKKPATRPMRTSRTRRILAAWICWPDSPRILTQAALFLDVDGVLAPIVARPRGCARPGRDARRASAAERALRARRVHLRPCRATTHDGSSASRSSSTSATTGSSSTPRRPSGATGCSSSSREVGWPATREQGAHGVAPLPRRGRTKTPRARRSRTCKLRAERQGFVARFGRKVLEVLPPLDVHKGTAVRQLLARAGPPARALRRRRHDRPRRLPSARRPRPVGSGRGRVGRGPGRAA